MITADENWLCIMLYNMTVMIENECCLFAII